MKGNGQNHIEEFMLGLRVHYLLGRTWKRNTSVKANSSVGVILVEEQKREDQGLRRTKNQQ